MQIEVLGVIKESVQIDAFLSEEEWAMVDAEVCRMNAFHSERGVRMDWDRDKELRSIFYMGLRALLKEQTDRREWAVLVESTGEPKPIEVTADVDA